MGAIMKTSVFDLKTLPVYPYEQREKNVFFSTEGFKARIIVLSPGEQMPECDMHTAVLFYVVVGEVEVTVDGDVQRLTDGHCLIGGPGRFSMRTTGGVRLLGVQIETKKSRP